MKSGNGKVQNDQVRSTPVPQNMQTSGLWAFESRHDPSFAMKTTRHRFLKLLWIREGSGAIEFDGEIKDCEMGDLVLVPPRLRHRIIDSVRNPLSLYGLGVDSNRLHCIASVLKGFSAGIYREPKFRTLLVEQRLRKILYLIDQPGAPSQLSSVATAIDLLAELALVLDPPKTSKIKRSGATRHGGSLNDPLLEAYLAWLHRNFYEALSLDGAAAASKMSRRTFTNQFRSRTGTTWLEYVNILRVQHAEELLKETDRKVTSIAFQCGFDDLSTFYRAFKRITGRNPAELRLSR